MKYLFLNQFYPPDLSPTGRVLHDLARCLVADGHEVMVVCSRRSYVGVDKFPVREIIDGVCVRRVGSSAFGRRTYIGKFFDYLSYYLSLFVRLLFLGWKPDIILSMTTPPYLGLLGKLFACLYKCRHAHWIMDLYPDVLCANRANEGREGKVGDNAERAEGRTWLIRMLEGLTRFSFSGSAVVLTIGMDMAVRASRYVEQSDDVVGGVRWVPLWSDIGQEPWVESERNDVRAALGVGDRMVLMYSGNMGLGHRFKEFLDAAEEMRGDDGVCWVFAGDGKRRLDIEKFCREHPDGNIKLLPYAPYKKLREHLCSADVHLVSMDGLWKGCVVPSKLQGSFGVGVPVIFVGPEDSSIAHWINESGGGWVVAENDVSGLLAAVAEARNLEERKRRGVKAREYAERNFDVNSNCRRIIELLACE